MIIGGQLSPCLRLQTVIASVAIPQPRGHLLRAVRTLKMVRRCYLTCLVAATSLQKERKEMFTIALSQDLASENISKLIYVQKMGAANPMLNNLVFSSQLTMQA